MIRRFAACCAVLALLASPALAQQAVDASGPIELHQVDPEANLVEELIVNARLPGPAWWKVSDADTTVYVHGRAGPGPRRPEGRRLGVCRRRVDGANVLIMGQEADRQRGAGWSG
jgi:hypothetical protein